MQEKAEKHKQCNEFTGMDRVSQDPGHSQVCFSMQPRMEISLHSVVSRQSPEFREGSEKKCRSRNCQQIHSCNYEERSYLIVGIA